MHGVEKCSVGALGQRFALSQAISLCPFRTCPGDHLGGNNPTPGDPGRDVAGLPVADPLFTRPAGNAARVALQPGPPYESNRTSCAPSPRPPKETSRRQSLRNRHPRHARRDGTRAAHGRDLRAGGSLFDAPLQGGRGLSGRRRQGAGRRVSRYRRASSRSPRNTASI